MNKRTRKKRHIGEFKHYGLLVKFDATEQEFDKVNEFIEDLCDKRKLYVWGGGFSNMSLQHTKRSYKVPNAAVNLIYAIAANVGTKPTYVVHDPKKRRIADAEALREAITNANPIGKSVDFEDIDIYNC